jgi:hypothetical protein
MGTSLKLRTGDPPSGPVAVQSWAAPSDPRSPGLCPTNPGVGWTRSTAERGPCGWFSRFCSGSSCNRGGVHKRGTARWPSHRNGQRREDSACQKGRLLAVRFTIFFGGQARCLGVQDVLRREREAKFRPTAAAKPSGCTGRSIRRGVRKSTRGGAGRSGASSSSRSVSSPTSRVMGRAVKP